MEPGYGTLMIASVHLDFIANRVKRIVERQNEKLVQKRREKDDETMQILYAARDLERFNINKRGGLPTSNMPREHYKELEQRDPRLRKVRERRYALTGR